MSRTIRARQWILWIERRELRLRLQILACRLGQPFGQFHKWHVSLTQRAQHRQSGTQGHAKPLAQQNDLVCERSDCASRGRLGLFLHLLG
jgi:hypothetical protein